jgi:hypothetical protein
MQYKHNVTGVVISRDDDTVGLGSEWVAVDGSESSGGPTKADLLEKAQQLDIEGRSSMNKRELEKAIAAAEQA